MPPRSRLETCRKNLGPTGEYPDPATSLMRCRAHWLWMVWNEPIGLVLGIPIIGTNRACQAIRRLGKTSFASGWFPLTKIETTCLRHPDPTRLWAWRGMWKRPNMAVLWTSLLVSEAGQGKAVHVPIARISGEESKDFNIAWWVGDERDQVAGQRLSRKRVREGNT